MKCVFAIFALLYLCSDAMPNRSLNREIIKKLDTLNKHHTEHKLNITSEYEVHFPNVTKNDFTSCVAVFVRELNSLLDNVTLHEKDKHTVQGLRRNLVALKLHHKDAGTCSVMSKDSLNPFQLFATFIRKMNSKKR